MKEIVDLKVLYCNDVQYMYCMNVFKYELILYYIILYYI